MQIAHLSPLNDNYSKSFTLRKAAMNTSKALEYLYFTQFSSRGVSYVVWQYLTMSCPPVCVAPQANPLPASAKMRTLLKQSSQLTFLALGAPSAPPPWTSSTAPPHLTPPHFYYDKEAVLDSDQPRDPWKRRCETTCFPSCGTEIHVLVCFHMHVCLCANLYSVCTRAEENDRQREIYSNG